MKIKIKPEDKELIDWVDKTAKKYRRSRGQQILWFLSRLKRVDMENDSSFLVSKEYLFVKNKP